MQLLGCERIADLEQSFIGRDDGLAAGSAALTVRPDTPAAV